MRLQSYTHTGRGNLPAKCYTYHIAQCELRLGALWPPRPSLTSPQSRCGRVSSGKVPPGCTPRIWATGGDFQTEKESFSTDDELYHLTINWIFCMILYKFKLLEKGNNLPLWWRYHSSRSRKRECSPQSGRVDPSWGLLRWRGTQPPEG